MGVSARTSAGYTSVVEPHTSVCPRAHPTNSTQMAAQFAYRQPRATLLQVTGIGALVCAHGQVASMQPCVTPGERFGYACVAIANALKGAKAAGVDVKALFYDVMCRFWKHFRREYPDVVELYPNLVGAIGRVHIYMHGPDCKRDYNGMLATFHTIAQK